MADVVALPEPQDEGGLKAALMGSARFACDDDCGIVAYALVALYDDGRTATGGCANFDGSTPMNARLFAGLVAEEARSHFVTASEIDRHLYVDPEC